MLTKMYIVSSTEAPACMISTENEEEVIKLINDFLSIKNFGGAKPNMGSIWNLSIKVLSPDNLIADKKLSLYDANGDRKGATAIANEASMFFISLHEYTK